MTNKEHTPGPWDYDPDHDGGGTPLGWWRVDPTGTSEAEAYEHGAIAEVIYREADARLIAAAPDMLELVKDYDRQVALWFGVDSIYETSGELFAWKALAERARAAIAQAKGEAQ